MEFILMPKRCCGKTLLMWCVLAGLLGSGSRPCRAQEPGNVPAPAGRPLDERSAPAVGPAFGPQESAGQNLATIDGVVTDTTGAAIPAAHVTLEQVESKAQRSVLSEAAGVFSFAGVPPGNYRLTITAAGFAEWKISGIIVLHEHENFVVPKVEMGVEAISTSVEAISIEDLAEVQITAEEHQRILGVLPNFYVSYVRNAAPLTRKQKFKLAVTVSTDPITFFTTGVSAGIEQWQNDFSGYGQGFGGYAQRYAAAYGDHLSGTFFGAAIFPSLFHQDPRYFYRGTGNVLVRALYAISTVVICRGDNGHFQPNYSNVLGNLTSGALSSLYYPRSDQHSVQVTIDNTLIGTASGAFGTLFQEFLLRHLTHGAPPLPPKP